MSGWDVELLLARDARSRRALANDRIKGITRHVRHGVYVEESALAGLTKEDKQVIAARALVAVSDRPIVLSHWTAAVLHRLPTVGDLGRVHATFTEPGARGLEGVASHLLALSEEEVVELHGLLVTDIGRTVVDVASAGTFEDGVVVADAALAAGLPREMLEAAVDLAGPRRSSRRIAEVVAFADANGKSAGESASRCTMRRIGVHPMLQRRHFDHRGYIGTSDFWFPETKAIGEFDGRVKFFDPAFAPNGAAEVLWNEKVREDRLRAVSDGFARWGWPEARDARLLAPILRAAGVVIPIPRARRRRTRAPARGQPPRAASTMRFASAWTCARSSGPLKDSA